MKKQFKSLISMVLSAAMVVALGSGVSINTKSVSAFGYDLSDEEKITLYLRQNHSKVFETDPSDASGTLAELPITQSGIYTLTATAADDIVDVAGNDDVKFISVELGVKSIPESLKIKTRTLTVKHTNKDGSATVANYNWDTPLFPNGNKEGGELRFGVVNTYITPNSKTQEEYGLSNPFRTNVNGTWAPTESIDVQQGDLVSFTLEVHTSNEPTNWEEEHPYQYSIPAALVEQEAGAKTPMPRTPAPATPTPNMETNSYIDYELWAKKGIHAYVSYQTTTWDYRNAYYDLQNNLSMDRYEYIQASGKEIDGAEAEVTDVLVDQDNAEYTVRLEGIDLSAATKCFNMLSVATDLDRRMYPGVKMEKVSIRFDGKQVLKDGILVDRQHTDPDYYNFMAIDRWDSDGYIVGYPLQEANDLGDLIMPKNSIEITFTISGIGKALEDIASGTYIDPETGKPIGSIASSSPHPSNQPETIETPKPSESPLVTEIPWTTKEPDYTKKPDESENPGINAKPTKVPVTQPDDNDLIDDAFEQDLKVRGLDIATDNIVKKGFLSVPRVQLTWDANRNCDGYEIWKKVGTQSFVKVDYIDDSDETEWFDTNLKKGYTYTYQVLGYREEDDGTVSRAKDGDSVSVQVRQTVKSCTYTAKRTGKKLKITFKKAEGIKYQIQVKYGKNKKWKKVSGSLKKKIVKKVSPKKLKVRIRTGEKVNGKMKYSKWSKVKTVQ